MMVSSPYVFGFRQQRGELSQYRTLHGKSARNPQEKHTEQKQIKGDFPGGPVVGTLRSQCRGPKFNPWSRKLDPTYRNYACVPQLLSPHAVEPTRCKEEPAQPKINT